MPTLFSVVDLGPETVTAEVVLSAIIGSNDPRTMTYWPDLEGNRDIFDYFYPGNEQIGVPVDVPNLGVLTALTAWGESTDGYDIGLVVRHEETGKEYLLTGVYSSWDGSNYEKCVEAEEYEFTETRWREKA